MNTPDMRSQLEQLLAPYRGTDESPTSHKVEELYTSGCAEMLRLEAELLRLKRRLAAAEADSAHDASARREAAKLRGLREETFERLEAARALVRSLRTALDWVHDSAA